MLLTGATAALLAVRPWAAEPEDVPGAPGPAVSAVARDVAGWLEEQVPDDTPVTASGQVRSALEEAGFAGRLSDADGTLQVVDGEPAAGAVVLARLGSGDATLSVVDPAPGLPTPDELDRREGLAAAVLANPVAGATGRSADVLRAADVDARLLGLLAGLVSRLDVHIADLPPAPGEPADGPPARWLLVDTAGGERLSPGAPATEELVTFLEAQRPPFAPDTVRTTDEGVLVGFDYVSAPDEVVSAATP